jgi:hypothetical protein
MAPASAPAEPTAPKTQAPPASAAPTPTPPSPAAAAPVAAPPAATPPSPPTAPSAPSEAKPTAATYTLDPAKGALYVQVFKDAGTVAAAARWTGSRGMIVAPRGDIAREASLAHQPG